MRTFALELMDELPVLDLTSLGAVQRYILLQLIILE